MRLSTGIIIVFLLSISIGVFIAIADKLFTVDDDEHEESGDETIEGAEESSRWLNGFALQVSALYAHIRDISKVFVSLLKPILCVVAFCVGVITRYSLFSLLVGFIASVFFGVVIAIALWPVTLILAIGTYGNIHGFIDFLEMAITWYGGVALVGLPLALIFLMSADISDELEEFFKDFGSSDGGTSHNIVTWKNIGLLLLAVLGLPFLLPFAAFAVAGEASSSSATSSSSSQSGGSPGRVAIAAGLIGYWIGSSRKHK
jgi:hypothetical protein